MSHTQFDDEDVFDELMKKFLHPEEQPAIKLPKGIPFTQYLRPNGVPRPMWFDTDAEHEHKAEMVIAAGAHFDMEELTTGTISMTCEKPGYKKDDSLVCIELSENGPAVVDAVHRLVDKAYERLVITKETHEE